MDNVEDRLWNPEVDPSSYVGAGEKYQNAIMDQYKLCVEMADRISARRNLTNTFFLSLNSAVVGVLGVSAPVLAKMTFLFLAAGVAILVGQCAAWFVLVRSYRQLNDAKWRVVGVIEKRLPASAFWKAEWAALGEGRDWRKYLPFTHVEQVVPLLFASAYVLGLVAIVVS
ncbi:MAG TPA: hypothetical protein VI076_13865 [Actinopolymorphaceae bacterium]